VSVARGAGERSTDLPDIPVFKPLLETEEHAAAAAALELGWLGMGSYVGDFESAIEEALDAHERHVVALSTGHAALHLALLLAEVGPGDEVITPAFNNITDFQAIIAVGAEPVFCDVDPLTLCIDLTRAEELMSTRTKAVIVMDYGCLLCDHDAVAEFAHRHSVRVIHDAAHSFGSRYEGRAIGSFSDLCMFSFDPVKLITSIDGGALVVRSEEELAALREMRLVGMGQPSTVMYENKRAWTYDVRRLGFRYHMANLHAAIGLAQLGKIDRIISSRREACRALSAGLAPLDGVTIPSTDFEDVAPFLYWIRVADGRRDVLRDHLRARGVDTGIHWQPGHRFSLFEDCRRGSLEQTDRVADEILSLPLHSEMEEVAIHRILDAVESGLVA
jgi:dTDP-4-amino-4,6-dideoxygalactose transaminase